MPMVTGKKHRYIEMTAFGSNPLKPRLPSTTTTIGAMARMGTVCEAMIHGSRLRSSTGRWMMPMASVIPRMEPNRNPTRVADTVTPA